METFRSFLILIGSRFNLVVAGFALVSLAGCLTSPGSEGGNNSDSNGGNGGGVSVRPAFLCGEGRAVASADENGNVACSAPTFKGLASKDAVGNAPRCAQGQEAELIKVGDVSEPLEIALCHEADNTNDDTVTLGDSPTLEFSCPMGSALKGFTDRGEPICVTLVDRELSGVALVMQPEDCPWGMMPGTFMHSQFSVPTCVIDDDGGREMRLIGQFVTKFGVQNNTRCQSDRVVIGFDEDHRIICGPAPTGLAHRPSRYWTVKFDGSAERPVCLPGYGPAPILLRRESGRGAPIKVWTCVDGI